jgi:hypothetical protein
MTMKSSKDNHEYATSLLVDVDPVFLVDRWNWPDFKRAINEVALAWNIPDWVNTILYQGDTYIEMKKKVKNLDTLFPEYLSKKAADEAAAKKAELEQAKAAVAAEGGAQAGAEVKVEMDMSKLEASSLMMGFLGLPKNISEYIQPTMRFCNIRTMEFESERKLPSRQKMWAWILKSLQGPKSVPGPYYYLVNEVKPYDILKLFQRLCGVLEQVTICSLDDELEAVIKLEFDAKTQNIFTFIADLRKAIKRLDDLNERLPEGGKLILPDTYLRSRIIRAARQLAIYKPVVDALLILPVDKWSKITSEELYVQLEQMCANDRSMKSSVKSPTTQESVVANIANAKKEKKKNNQNTCFEFSKSGECSKPNCP